ncbi:MAG: diguanylate cyclase [Cyanobacteria bacterium P01_C01_bin.72]
MITSLNLLYSQQSDLFPIRQRFQAHPSQQTLIQVFSGRVRRSQVESILIDLTEVFPNTPIVGTTTAGEICDGQAWNNTVVINFSFFESTVVKSSIVNCNGDLQLAGKTLARNFANSQPQALIVFGCSIKDGNKINATQLLTALAEALPKTIIAGGQAGDNGNGKITYVFTENEIVDYGAAAVSLTGEHLVVNNTFNLSWIPIGKKFKITKVVGQRVYRIDDRTPLELYNYYLGAEVVDELPLSAADFPLMTEREGMTMAIHPLFVHDDGSFDYIYCFDLGEQVQFGFCHSGLLQTAADKTFEELKRKPMQTAFIYSCVSRKWILGRDIDLDIAPIEKLASTTGFFAYGEYFTRTPGKCLHFGQTMTVLTLAETNEIKQTSENKKSKSWVVEQDSKQLKTLRVLHRLVETSARETELANQKLAEMAHKDGLTGLLNRRYFDCRFADEFQLARRTKAPLSLIMIDVDEFKLYNDTYGHIKGDSCLCTVADVLRQIPQRAEDVVCRYGGEEFIYILPNTDFEGAMNLAEQIRRDFDKIAIPHATSRVANYLTVSIGIQTATLLDRQMTAEKLIELCDQQLYLAKQSGRNRVCGAQTA